MKSRKYIRLLTLFGTVFVLAACSAPKGEKWPTVSFGDDIAATEAAQTAATKIALAPLPTLTGEERRGADNPGQFLQQLETDFSNQARRIFDRKEDYMLFRQGLEGAAVVGRFKEDWLGANMELSNISQTTERLKVIRAQIMLLGDAMPEGAEVLLKRVEALELENRLFVRDERAFLNLTNPDG